MKKLLEIQNLNKSFEGITPLQNISMDVEQQEIVLISGDNGAGKTTIFNLITGLEKPNKGSIIFEGKSLLGHSALDIARKGIVRLYQKPRIFKNLKVWENLVVASKKNLGNNFFNLLFKPKLTEYQDKKLKKKAFDLLIKFNLQDIIHNTSGELSYGQQKLVSFCMLVMNETRLALLDEPFAGLNPDTIQKLSNMILNMRSEGITFLLIEHNISKASKIADKRIEIKNGIANIIVNKITSS